MLATISASAQTNLLETPYHPCRQVDNKYYSLQPIYDWMELPHSDRTVRPMQEWIGEPAYRMYNLLFRVEQVLPDGLLLSSSGEYLRGIERADFDSHNPIFLKNYPYKNLLVDGQIIRLLAIKIGNHQYTATDGAVRTVALYDYGVPCDSPPPPPPLTPEQIAAAKAKAVADKKANEEKGLKYNQELAAKGDPYGLLRMGERCRDGDGVPKDLAKARDYFTKAVAAGSPSAADALSGLDPSTNAATTKQ